MTITEFLRARIAEDEAAARSEDERAAQWHRDFRGASFAITEWQAGAGSTARVLAECEAKRRIVEIHASFPQPNGPVCVTCEERQQIGEEALTVDWPCDTLRALASVYADHPDYDPAWRA